MIDIETAKWVAGICGTGYCLFINGERNRIIKDIREIKQKAETAYTKAETLGELVHVRFLTKEEHKDFDNRISSSIDKLTDRIDVVLAGVLKKSGV